MLVDVKWYFWNCKEGAKGFGGDLIFSLLWKLMIALEWCYWNGKHMGETLAGCPFSALYVDQIAAIKTCIPNTASACVTKFWCFFFFVFWVLTFSWFCFLVLLRLETVACWNCFHEYLSLFWSSCTGFVFQKKGSYKGHKETEFDAWLFHASTFLVQCYRPVI